MLNLLFNLIIASFCPIFQCVLIVSSSNSTHGDSFETSAELPNANSFAKLSFTSGAAKRRKKREAAKNVQKLSAYFRPIHSALLSQTAVQPETVQCTACECDISHTSSTLHGLISAAADSDQCVVGGLKHQLNLEFVNKTTIETANSSFSGNAITTTDLPNVGMEVLSSSTTSEISQGAGDSDGNPVDPYQTVIDQLLHELHPTDRGHYPVDITGDNALLLKTFIVEHGSCRPTGPFPRVVDPGRQYNRCFSETHYKTRNKAGVEIPILWLCYSPMLDAAYCEPCWLFADRSDPAYRPAWSSGIRNWRDLSRKIEEHARVPLHISSCLIYEQWKNHGTVDEKLHDEIRQESCFWRAVLKRLVKITLLLATNSLPFRGHRETIGDVYNGNFLAQVELLAEFDPLMNELIKKPKNKVKYLSPTIQNELIDVLSSHLEKNIVSDIMAAPFFSVITDTTQDISKVDQLSQVIRYVQILKSDDDRPTSVDICESFLGFYACADQTAGGLSEQIVSTVQGKGLSFSKCRGQGYDGARTMSGIYNGVQKRIMDIQPKAKYVHCAAHNLNLVVNDAINGVQEAQAFFTILQELYTFFGHSIRRWDLLSSVTGESQITLKKLNPTRWAGRLMSIMGIKHRYVDVMKSLTRLILGNGHRDEREEAARLKKQIECFEFVLHIVIMAKILAEINTASQYLQSKDADIERATEHLRNAAANLTEIRTNFKAVKEEAVNACMTWGVVPSFAQKRKSKRKRHFEELAEDSRLTDPENCFRVNVFYKMLDIASNQITSRFEAITAVVEKFSVLNPVNLTRLDEHEIVEAATGLQEEYSDDLSEAFPMQLVTFKASLKIEIAKVQSIRQLAHMLIVEHSAVSSAFPDVFTALVLFLTLPVTVAGAERSFSKLKIIKSYLRNTMGQSRLRGLSLLAIEASRAKLMNTDLLINEFAEMKARRFDLRN